MGDHRQFRHDHRGIFNKVRIRIIRRRGQYGDLQAKLQQGFHIGEKLAGGGGDIRRAQPGGSLSCAAGGGRETGDSLGKMHKEPSGSGRIA
jgi:hypothetical protein